MGVGQGYLEGTILRTGSTVWRVKYCRKALTTLITTTNCSQYFIGHRILDFSKDLKDIVFARAHDCTTRDTVVAKDPILLSIYYTINRLILKYVNIFLNCIVL
jgi:hypothetical protein